MSSMVGCSHKSNNTCFLSVLSLKEWDPNVTVYSGSCDVYGREI